jgi:hypothetical protein
MNTKNETPGNSSKTENGGDLDSFAPSPPAVRLDDKAATLENDILDLKVRFNRERFVYIFIATVLAASLIGPTLSGWILAFFLLSVFIFLISIGEYLDFPWAVVPMKRWMDLAYRACEKRALGKGGNEPPAIEPPPDQ